MIADLTDCYLINRTIIETIRMNQLYEIEMARKANDIKSDGNDVVSIYNKSLFVMKELGNYKRSENG